MDVAAEHQDLPAAEAAFEAIKEAQGLMGEIEGEWRGKCEGHGRKATFLFFPKKETRREGYPKKTRRGLLSTSFHEHHERGPGNQSSSPARLLRGFPSHGDLVQHFDLGLLSLRQPACCPALAVTDGQRCR